MRQASWHRNLRQSFNLVIARRKTRREACSGLFMSVCAGYGSARPRPRRTHTCTQGIAKPSTNSRTITLGLSVRQLCLCWRGGLRTFVRPCNLKLPCGEPSTEASSSSNSSNSDSSSNYHNLPVLQRSSDFLPSPAALSTTTLFRCYSGPPAVYGFHTHTTAVCSAAKHRPST